jgi:pentatricopeptide repeat protein
MKIKADLEILRSLVECGDMEEALKVIDSMLKDYS